MTERLVAVAGAPGALDLTVREWFYLGQDESSSVPVDCLCSGR